MKCLHCGYCCVMLDVVIINPEYIDEVNHRNIRNLKDDKYYLIKKNNEICPYLFKLNGHYYCLIHEEKWYKYTPCFKHTQIGKPNAKCRIGSNIESGTKSGILLKNYIDRLFEEKHGSERNKQNQTNSPQNEN
jgi:hypothetical protein